MSCEIKRILFSSYCHTNKQRLKKIDLSCYELAKHLKTEQYLFLKSVENKKTNFKDYMVLVMISE